MKYTLSDKEIESGVKVNEVLAQESHKPVIKEFKRRKVYVRFKDNICAAVLDEVGSLLCFNLSVQYLLYVIDVFTKYAQAKLLKDEKAKAVLHRFIEIVNKSKRQSNKLWVDQRR